MISYWDELSWTRREKGHIAGDWQSLTSERSLWLGAQRIRVDAGKWATPLHLEASEEEIFYVLSGTGVSLQLGDDGTEQAFAVGPGDCLVHLALEHAHTLGAGPDGIEVVAFGERHYAANTFLPRAGVSWLGPTWVREGAPEDHPGHVRRRSARRRSATSPSGRRASSTRTPSKHAAGRGKRLCARSGISVGQPAR